MAEENRILSAPPGGTGPTLEELINQSGFTSQQMEMMEMIMNDFPDTWSIDELTDIFLSVDSRGINAGDEMFTELYGSLKALDPGSTVREDEILRAKDRPAFREGEVSNNPLNSVYQLAKMLDPGSTFREGEYLTFKNSRGLSDDARNSLNAIIGNSVSRELDPGSTVREGELAGALSAIRESEMPLGATGVVAGRDGGRIFTGGVPSLQDMERDDMMRYDPPDLRKQEEILMRNMTER